MPPPISPLPLMASSPIPSPPAARPGSGRALAAVVPCNSSASPSSSTSTSSVALAGGRRGVLALGAGFLASAALLCPAGDAGATRIEYFATVGEKLCDMDFAKSGLGYCDVEIGTGVQPKRGELINIHYTARFPDGTVFDSSYKRGRPLTMRIGGVTPMLVGGKRKLMIPPILAYGPEPAGCFSGDCNIPGNSTILYDILLVGIYK
ncbi:unnamed protein product [Triticum turgidum subsp. durum]|uniref:peptidylprolyl isomerase n=1 Tax=Triticum turgidum subsp. durum TaxID=4567 RepID=A0A9R0YTJ7_TRITD|nr:unnamed protein product [Triticum turgidum subsp. durum]